MPTNMDRADWTWLSLFTESNYEVHEEYIEAKPGDIEEAKNAPIFMVC